MRHLSLRSEDLETLKPTPGWWYLGSPYSKHPLGIEAAYREICAIAARIMRHGVPVFSPIAHSHSVSVHGLIDPLDHEFWLPADAPFMQSAYGLLVAKMESWEESFGLRHEIEEFAKQGKPIFYLEV